MGKVLIIKNNSREANIYEWVKESYNTKTPKYYNTKTGSANERYIIEHSDDLKTDSIILFITYDQTDENKIQDIYLGDVKKINESTNVVYTMYRYMTEENDGRAIDSILDKIDLDISGDFELGRYVYISDMDSLYKELRERIDSVKQKKVYSTSENEIESQNPYELCKLAQKDSQSIRIFESKRPDETRTEFQRDRERVVNSKAFRRLVDKAQIFGADKGDYYRTRMTHTLEVNQIAKAIAYALGLNLDLTEAIALGHDLGHTPFGHQGERTLDDILSGKIKIGIEMHKDMLEKRCFGGFKHNYQSARILTLLEEKYIEHPGLNVSVQVVEGVLKHTRLKESISLEDFLDKEYIEKMNISYEKRKIHSATLEGQTVAIADEIAQRGHDVDDALTSGVMTIEEFIDRLKISKCDQLKQVMDKEMEKVGQSQRLIADEKELKIARIVSCIIQFMISDTISNSKKLLAQENSLERIDLMNEKILIDFSEETAKVNSYLERVVQKKVICNSEVARADYNASNIIQTLFKKYYENPRLLHSGTIHKIFIETLNSKNELVSNSAVDLEDASIEVVNNEIQQITRHAISEKGVKYYLLNKRFELPEDEVIFEKRRILIRNIVDFIAGMTDGYAVEEYEKLK